MSAAAGSGRAVPQPGAAIVAIALNTFREAIRDRVLYLLLVFALILIGVSRLLSLLTVGDEAKIIKDVGLSALSVFGVLTAVFVGVSLTVVGVPGAVGPKARGVSTPGSAQPAASAHHHR